MRYRANAKVISPGGKELGRVTYTVKAKNKSGALTKLRQMMKAKNRKRKKNVEMGFWDAKGFHPMRASRDYSGARAGEGRAGGRARAKRATKKARRGRQAIS
jgi:hypothetical protein